jgi:hypothetical protein
VPLPRALHDRAKLQQRRLLPHSPTHRRLRMFGRLQRRDFLLQLRHFCCRARVRLDLLRARLRLRVCAGGVAAI